MWSGGAGGAGKGVRRYEVCSAPHDRMATNEMVVQIEGDCRDPFKQYERVAIEGERGGCGWMNTNVLLSFSALLLSLAAIARAVGRHQSHWKAALHCSRRLWRILV